MGQLPQLQQARRRLGLALDGLRHDRWVLGYLRAGRLQPIAASEVSRRFLQGRPLMPLARRALYEKCPTVMNSLIENPNPTMGYDWELDWPSLPVSYTHLRAHETRHDLVCRLLLEKKKKQTNKRDRTFIIR